MADQGAVVPSADIAHFHGVQDGFLLISVARVQK
jgi:hypothetical protein